MKTALCFLFLLLCLVACTTTGEPAPILSTIVRGATDATIAADTNVDGRVSNRELKDFTSNPLLWLGLIGTILGGGATMKSQRQQKELDELYDKTHKPIAE
jgi:hypothetical protein